MKLYDKIKKLLIEYPELRNSDKKLLWCVWNMSGFVIENNISRENFYRANSAESITRARRKVQELHPELGGNREVRIAREKKQLEKGTFIFREQQKFI